MVTSSFQILPSFLGSLPDFLTNANCYRTFLSTSSEKSCRYVPREAESDDEAADDLAEKIMDAEEDR